MLSCGRGELSKAIRLLDGGNYSHAAICTNVDERYDPKIVESTKKGVVENPLSPDIKGQKYVDVYRFKSDTGENFGVTEWPHEPVIDRANYYRNKKTQYAFHQLYLMSVLIMVRKAPLGQLGRANIRYWLDQMIRFFKDDLDTRKEHVTCSELVYRCYYEAQSIPKGKYGLTIRGTIGPNKSLVKAISQDINGTDSDLDSETDKLLREAEDLFWQTMPKFRSNLESLKKPEGDIRLKVWNPNVSANTVTPCDLQMSPNLEFIGRLRD